jgi:hypothetical protein
MCLLSMDDVGAALNAELRLRSRLLPLGLGASIVGEALCAPAVNPVEIDLGVERSGAAKRVVG